MKLQEKKQQKKKNFGSLPVKVNGVTKFLHPNEANNPCLTNSRWGMCLVLGRYVGTIFITFICFFPIFFITFIIYCIIWQCQGEEPFCCALFNQK